MEWLSTNIICVDAWGSRFYGLPMTQDAFLHMRIAKDVKQTLDGLRKAEPDLPSQAEMVRRLIERAAAKKKQ